MPWSQGQERIYLLALSRPPTPEEIKVWEKYRDEVKNLETTYRDMLWALINSSEFILNH